MTKTLKTRSYAEYLRDPNFNGAFVGGPPLLSPRQTQRLLESPEKAEEDARRALKKLRRRYEKKRSAKN